MAIKKEETPRADIYYGTAEELIAADLATIEQFPGQPGNRAFGQSFYRGVPTGRHQRVPRDQHYLSISRYGGKFKLEIGLPGDVAKERYAAFRKELDQKLERERARRERDAGNSELHRLRSLNPVGYNLFFSMADRWEGDHGIPFCRLLFQTLLSQDLREGPRRPDATA